MVRCNHPSVSTVLNPEVEGLVVQPSIKQHSGLDRSFEAQNQSVNKFIFQFKKS